MSSADLLSDYPRTGAGAELPTCRQKASGGKWVSGRTAMVSVDAFGADQSYDQLSHPAKRPRGDELAMCGSTLSQQEKKKNNQGVFNWSSVF
jgi:hypothetical protein